MDERLFQQDIKILIVDDDRMVIQSIKDYLQSENTSWHISQASDGFEAGRMLTRLNPDLIILDLFLPGINGFNLCRNIKNDPLTRHMKIIAMTGYPTEENISKVTEAGADNVIAKPIEMDCLVGEIKKLVS